MTNNIQSLAGSVVRLSTSPSAIENSSTQSSPSYTSTTAEAITRLTTHLPANQKSPHQPTLQEPLRKNVTEITLLPSLVTKPANFKASTTRVPEFTQPALVVEHLRNTTAFSYRITNAAGNGSALVPMQVPVEKELGNPNPTSGSVHPSPAVGDTEMNVTRTGAIIANRRSSNSKTYNHNSVVVGCSLMGAVAIVIASATGLYLKFGKTR